MKLLLIDGNSMLFRAYYATYRSNLLENSNGIYINAVYAFAKMIFKAIETLKPSHCAVAFDKGKHTFRHDLADSYKANRPKVPEELVSQFALVREFLNEAEIPFFEYDEIEGDDILGSLSKRYAGTETVVLTSDRDMLQLVDDSTSVCLMIKGISEIEVMDEKAVKEKFAISPKQVIDLKALMGDSSDNIKGVQGIGEKTAIKLLSEYGDVDNIYNHLDDIKGKVHNYLENGRDDCYLSRTLATIKTDIEIPVELNDLIYEPNIDRLNDFYKKYKMFSLIRKTNPLPGEYKTKVVKEISEHFYADDVFIYFDSNEFSYYQREIFGLVFANSKDAEYITFQDFLHDQKALSFLNSDKNKTVYDLKAIYHIADKNNFNINNADDLMLEAFLINNYLSSLNDLFVYYGKRQSEELNTIYGTIKKPLPIDHQKQVNNAVYRSFTAFSILREVRKELEEKDLIELYKNIELPLVKILFEMEKEGISCNRDILANIAKETKKKMDDCAYNIFKEVGHEFNLNSPKQLSDVLFDELHLKANKKRSTSADALESLAKDNQIVSQILEYRKQSKLYSTYAEGLQKYIKDNKIHTIFSQTSTQTGRLSSSEPNMQNISVRDEEGRTIRKAFNAGDGYVFMDADYSQIELRVLASLADEKHMIDAFNNHEDIHTSTAMHIFGLKREEVTPLMRRRAKAVNFGIVYGISDFGLAKQIDMPKKEAAEFIDEYFKTYPNIKKYLDAQVDYCREHGYVLTMMKRRRYIKEINSHKHLLADFGERAAKNAPIQGSAADLMKMAMIRCDNLIKENNLSSKMILQIHDELLFLVPDNEIEIMKDIIKDGMDNVYELRVKLESSLGISSSWYEAK